jgi:hypothetical protein
LVQAPDVIHTIRKLAREIDRRPVLAVLVLFLVLSWAALEVVDFLTTGLGLPFWTPRLALVLLVIGLPIVLATTVVQGGLPWLRIRDVMDPNELEGRTPAEVHVVPEAHPMYGVGLFTWRNAILGGVMAAALLVTSVVTYLTLWTLGIGPVGSLLAQGLISEDDAIVVASFDNLTEDPVVTAAIRDDLEAALARSGLVRVLLHTPPSDGAAARALVDPKAMVVGEVEQTRSGYRIRTSIVLPDGTSLARFEQRATSVEGLGLAVELLSFRLRERLGESLRVIQSEREAALEAAGTG